MSSMTRDELAEAARAKALGDGAAPLGPDDPERARWLGAVGLVLDAERARADEFLRALKGCLRMVAGDIERGRYDADGRPGISDVVTMIESERHGQAGLAFGRAMVGLFARTEEGDLSDWPTESQVPEWVSLATSNPAINLLLDGLRQALGEHAARNRRHYTLSLRVTGVTPGDGGCHENGWTSHDAYASPGGFEADMGPHPAPLEPLPEPAEAFDPDEDTVGPFVEGLENGPSMPVYLVQWPSSKVSLVTAANERHLANVIDDAVRRHGAHRACRWRRYPGPVWVDLQLPVDLLAVSTDGRPLTPFDRVAFSSVRAVGLDRLTDLRQPMVAAHVPDMPLSSHMRAFENSVIGFGFPRWRLACLRAVAERRAPTSDEALAALAHDLRHGYEPDHDERAARARTRHNEDDPWNAPVGAAPERTVH